jgi:hypothetical protein
MLSVNKLNLLILIIMLQIAHTLDLERNTSIRRGNKVRLCDGSGLAFVDRNIAERYEENHVYIGYEYPELFGTHQELKDIVCKVVQTNIRDYIRVHPVCNVAGILDIVIDVNGVLLRTNSTFVTRV